MGEGVLRIGRMGNGRYGWRGDAKPVMEGFDDASALLGSGVYVLRQHGRVIFVGWAKCLLTMISAHREYATTKPPSWFPIKGVRFDSFEYRLCPAHRSDEELAKLREEVGLDRAA